MWFDGEEIPQSDGPEIVVVVGTPASGLHERHAELIDPESDGFDLVAGFVAQQTHKQLVDINDRVPEEFQSELVAIWDTVHDEIMDGTIPMYAFSYDCYSKYSKVDDAFICGLVTFNILETLLAKLKTDFK